MNTITQLFNGNVYFNGTSYAGIIEEANLPETKFKFTDKKSLSNFIAMKLPTGIDAMNCKFKLNSVNASTILLGTNPFTPVDIMVRSSIQNWDNGEKTSEEPLVAYIRGLPQGIPSMGLKPNDNAEIEISYEVTAYRLEIGGVVIFDIDAFANIYIVNGVDLMADYRANLGL